MAVVTVKPVEVLGCPVGNLWEVSFDGHVVGRVSYHGNSLVCVQGMVGQRAAVERAIEALYKRSA